MPTQKISFEKNSEFPRRVISQEELQEDCYDIICQDIVIEVEFDTYYTAKRRTVTIDGKYFKEFEYQKLRMLSANQIKKIIADNSIINGRFYNPQVGITRNDTYVNGAIIRVKVKAKTQKNMSENIHSLLYFLEQYNMTVKECYGGVDFLKYKKRGD